MTGVAYDGYELLTAEREAGVVTVTVASPPMNLMGSALLDEIDRVVAEVDSDPAALVLVLQSSVPGFFLCHASYRDLGRMKAPTLPESIDETPLNAVQQIGMRLVGMDTVSIAKVQGRATGGGAALALACDLRYGEIGSAVFNSFGVPMATGLGGGATQHLPRIIGRSRAMEVILGGLDLDAATADSWGYLTRAFESTDIDAAVTAIARRIAQSEPAIVRGTKELIAGAVGAPTDLGLREENFRLQRANATDAARQAIEDFLALGGETVDGESRLEQLLGEVLDRRAAS
ncbi:enoyl-CoA hydratase/isomerase family protein [Cnuibacter physcomitrellae]|uniref:enoyl-CoA hydratase/isomerase family protein n=1 Tax=Cnuibacter physcomitrellae TaxID=1619308 RepID=UPI002175BEFC|nr:enoyl-CoA hydratase/isomerase family protein [Cnuibacter physcomitrellae]MCS5498229.1 enoyl-CoA hydratase/isomerase family protein [Cnuibacter physcomitrellae]